MKKTITAIFMLVAVTLVGCGQTGPLYLPADEAPATEQTQ
ncbi:LPS translocon maturation chaperone LptM [Vibrio sp. 10N.286.49.B1]